LRSADFGLRIRGVGVAARDLSAANPQSAIRNPQFLGTVGMVWVTSPAGAPLAWVREERR